MLRLLPILLLTCAAACGGGGGGGGDAAPAPTPTPIPSDPFGLDQRTPLAALNLPTPGSATGSYDAVDAFPSLSFASPLFFAGVPGENRAIVLEQGGRVPAFTNDPGVTTTQTVLDLSGRVEFAGEQGLLGLAFDPGFTANRFFYVHYSMVSPRRSVIARFTWDAGTDVAALASERIILEVPQPFGNHNGGSLEFGPDGYLYIAFGDGGSGGDPQNHAQNLGDLLGTVLRVDVHPANPALPYDVPADNPFVGDGDPATLPEIWAYGLRNPYRMSFDRQTGELWLGDVGQSSLEEIDIVERGGNYGWSRFEGTQLFNDSIALQPPGATAIAPVHEYGRTEGVAVIGGYVYRGSAIASLFGRYLYSDFGSGNLWALDWDGTSVQGNDLLAVVDQPTSFGEDNQAEVYVVSRSGSILALTETTGPGPLPDTLSQTGLFTDLATLEPAPGLLEYDLVVPFWSDGAVKRRWIGLPGQTTIDFAAATPWVFPAGTVLVEHFEMALDEALSDARRRLETRVLVNDGSAWQGFTYRWNPGKTDADLLTARESEVLSIVDAQGVQRDQTYTYPSRADCLQCHTAVAGRVLGVRTHQLNRDFDFPLAVDNQLRTWNHIGLFSSDIGAPGQYAAFPLLDDDQRGVAERARAWLGVNCAVCHQPGGPTGVDIDLRVAIADAEMNVVDVAPSAGDLGIPNAAIVAAGAKERSVLWERLRRLDGERMPPLASHRVDDEGVDLVGRWIDAL